MVYEDKICIRGLRIFAHHGVYEEETRLGQTFVVNATLYTSTKKGGLQDCLEETISYADVCQFITDYLQQNTWKLLEAAVEHTCRALLLHYPLLHKVELALEKPSAPIPLPFDSVSVCITRSWHRVFVAMGSNMGDKQAYLDSAVQAMKSNSCIRFNKASTYYVTEPYGGVEQDDFLNAAIELETVYSPEELLDFLHDLEKAAKRERIVHWGPRTLDLDIRLYDNLVQDDPVLTLPHPDMQNRDFVLKPMAELSPHFVHPVLHQSMQSLLNNLKK